MKRSIASNTRLCLVLALFWLPAGNLLAADDATQIQLLEASLTLDRVEGEARLVTFPDYWNLVRRREAVSGQYLVEFELDEPLAGEEPVGFLIPNLAGMAEIRWDGEFLGESVSLTGVGTQIVSGPLLVSIPRSLRSVGRHVVEIDYRGSPGMYNFLRTPVIGPLSELSSVFVQKRITLVYLPIALGIMSIVVALVFFAVFRGDATLRGVGWLCAGLAASSWAVLGLYFAPPDWLSGIAIRLRPLLFHLSFLFFLFAILQIRLTPLRWTIRILVAIYAALTCYMFWVEDVDVYLVAALWMPLTWIVGLYLLIAVVRLALEPPRMLLTLVPMIVVPLNIAHDVIGSLNGGVYWADQVLGIYNPPMIAFALMLVLIARAKMHMSQVLTLNQELETRVEEKRKELELNYNRIAEAERRGAVLSERERMVRDMHDGLGSQLVSTLAMVESGQFSPSEVEDALRDSLDDLRIMVHSLDLEQSELVDLLAMVRERVEPRVTRQGLRFKWQVDEVNCSAPLDPEAAGHILRIVQEALTNIIKHARAQTITLSTGVDDHKRYVAIEDDGVGVGSQDTVIGRRGEGRGMHNMHKRAEQLGGSLLVTDGVEGGTRVTLWLPG